MSCRPGAAGRNRQSIQARPWLAKFSSMHTLLLQTCCVAGVANKHRQVPGLSARCLESQNRAEQVPVWLSQCSQRETADVMCIIVAVNSSPLYVKTVKGGARAEQAGRVLLGHAQDGAAWLGRDPWPPAQPRPGVLVRGGAAPRPLPPGDSESSRALFVHVYKYDVCTGPWIDTMKCMLLCRSSRRETHGTV